MIHSVKENCDNCKHAYIMTDTMCFGCNHPTRRYSCMIDIPTTCSDFEAGDPCYMGEDKAKDGCLLPHIQTNNPETPTKGQEWFDDVCTQWKDFIPVTQAHSTTSPDWHFDGDTLKYHGERDKMYTDMEPERSMSDDPFESIRTTAKNWKPVPQECYCKCSIFDKTPETVLQSCIELYRAKNQEYQNTEDPFENFTKGAELNKCTMEQALWGYVTKQIVSLASIIQTGKNREKIPEKARDIIVYMAILEAMQ